MEQNKKTDKLLEVRDLQVSFFTPAGEVKAVNGISYDLNYNEVMGVVGESGSGKSVEAYSIIGLLQDLSFEDWNRILSANLSSVFHCAKLAIPGMIHNHSGKIINISSVWGVCGASCEAAYSATKGGVNGLTMALAKELAPSDIQVNAIACGAIDTEMNGFLSEEEHEMLLDEIPAGRMGKPEEVADLVLKLVEAPDYLTGQVIKMDGGWI